MIKVLKKTHSNDNIVYLDISDYKKRIVSRNGKLIYNQEICDLLYEEIDVIKFKYSKTKKYKMLDFIFTIIDPFFIVSEKVIKTLNINFTNNSYLKFKKIKLVDYYTNEIKDCVYYLVLPNKIVQKDERALINDIAYSVSDFDENNEKDIFYRNMFYKTWGYFDELYNNLTLYISENLRDLFKKNKISGIQYEESNQINYEKWYRNPDLNLKDRIYNWLKLLDNNFQNETKFKYLYFTIIEERKGYNLSVGGFLTQAFDEEIIEISPNYCDLIGTELDELNWKDALNYVCQIIKEIIPHLNSIGKYQSFIGISDSQILKIKNSI